MIERLLEALEDASPEEMFEEIRTGKAQLWLGERSAMVTHVLEGTVRRLHVWLAGGELAEILALKPGVEAWGRAMGCKEVTINGRAGWARVLKDFSMVDGELRKPL